MAQLVHFKHTRTGRYLSIRCSPNHKISGWRVVKSIPKGGKLVKTTNDVIGLKTPKKASKK